MTDELTREALASNEARRITTAGTIGVLNQTCELLGTPQFLRIDNGREFIANTLRGWCQE